MQILHLRFTVLENALAGFQRHARESYSRIYRSTRAPYGSSTKTEVYFQVWYLAMVEDTASVQSFRGILRSSKIPRTIRCTPASKPRGVYSTYCAWKFFFFFVPLPEIDASYETYRGTRPPGGSVPWNWPRRDLSQLETLIKFREPFAVHLRRSLEVITLKGNRTYESVFAPFLRINVDYESYWNFRPPGESVTRNRTRREPSQLETLIT